MPRIWAQPRRRTSHRWRVRFSAPIQRALPRPDIRNDPRSIPSCRLVRCAGRQCASRADRARLPAPAVESDPDAKPQRARAGRYRRPGAGSPARDPDRDADADLGPHAGPGSGDQTRTARNADPAPDSAATHRCEPRAARLGTSTSASRSARRCRSCTRHRSCSLSGDDAHHPAAIDRACPAKRRTELGRT